nr:M20/M25/M40 family metallo-hydrolase [Ohessyouella blattaphilus]
MNEPAFNKTELLFQTHSDVVSGENMPDAFKSKIEGNKLFGRGSCDAKGQFCAMIWGLKMAYTKNPEKAEKVCIALCCDEEHKHRGVDALIQKKSEVLKGVVVGEPTELSVAIACKGSIRFRINTYGKAAHTSTPQDGENAIYLMAKVIRIIEDYVIPKVSTTSCDLCGNATVAVSLIRGGESVNAVPDSCSIHVDRRLIPGESWKEAYRDIEKTILEHLDNAEQELIRFEKPYLVDPSYRSDINNSFAKQFQDVLVEQGLKSEFSGLAYGCDASKMDGWRVPVFVFGPGSIKEAHTGNEYIDLQELEKAANVYKNLILSVIY